MSDIHIHIDRYWFTLFYHYNHSVDRI